MVENLSGRCGKMSKGSQGSIRNFTIRELIEGYSRANRLSSSTLSNLNLWEEKIGDVLVSDLNPLMVKGIRSERNLTHAVSTVNRELAVLKRVLNYSVNESCLIDRNPISGVSFLSGAVRRDRWITEEEEKRLLSHAPIWLGALIHFALNTGMRRSEILNLKWEHVFMDKGYLVVDKSKNGRKRNIPINTKARAVLTIAGPGISGVVFNNISVRSLEYAFNRAVNGAGIDDLHWHDLRHTFATKLVQSGCDLYRVQILMGHSSYDMVNRYAHHSVGSLRGAVENINL
jgi:integrase